jgi:endo-1,4-beta-xylanase
MNNNRTTCDPERIELFLQQKLSDKEQTAFELHLDDCNDCRRGGQWARNNMPQKANLGGVVLGLLLVGICSPAWGQIASNSTKFLGNILKDTTTPDPDFATYWNQVTPENSGKWGAVEGTQGVFNWTNLDYIYNYTGTHGIPLKEHNFVWGTHQPAWITGLSTTAQSAAVAQWIDAYGARYPNTQYIDVVNEPLQSPPPYAAALGGSGTSGWDWVIWSYQQARKACPNAKLLLNDYDILDSNANTTTYLTIINLLKARGLIDGIGEEAHFLETTPLSTIQYNLGRLAATGLPIYISELDLNLSDDTAQLDRYAALFPIFWTNPAVQGVTLWGYKQNYTWLPNTYLLRADGSERPALTWLKNYVAVAPPAGATWSGGGANGNWMASPGNWSSGTAPIFPSALTFAGTTGLTSTNDSVGSTLGGITFSYGAGAFNIGGNAITLAGNIVNNSSTNETISLNMTLTAVGPNSLNTTTNAACTMATLLGNITISGAISGSGSLTQTGTGILTLSGNNTYTGPTTINAGKLAVNGWLASPVTINSGGILGGTGSLTSVTVNAGGQLSPGNSPGVMYLSGNLTLLAGAAMDYHLDGLSTDDEISMPTGQLILSGQQFTDFNFTPLAGFGRGVYTLIDAGSISGGLGADKGGSIDGLPATLAVQGNNLVVNVVPEPATAALFGVGALVMIVQYWRRKRRI